MDKESIIAGILHDVVEDTPMTLEDLQAEFGEDVALLVDGVTKLTRLSWDCLLYTSVWRLRISIQSAISCCSSVS